MLYKRPAAKFLASFAAGMQNSIITTTTGFMRTTHHTGTVSDIGLLLGQLYPDNIHNRAHVWKLQILSGLVVVWMFAGAIGALLYEVVGDALAFVPGGIGLLIGTIGMVRETRLMRLKAERAAALAAAAPFLASKDVENHEDESSGMSALHAIATNMDGNLESMPIPEQMVSLRDESETTAKIELMCRYFQSRPSALKELESEAGETFENFIVHFAARKDGMLKGGVALQRASTRATAANSRMDTLPEIRTSSSGFLRSTTPTVQELGPRTKKDEGFDLRVAVP